MALGLTSFRVCDSWFRFFVFTCLPKDQQLDDHKKQHVGACVVPLGVQAAIAQIESAEVHVMGIVRVLW